MLIEEGNDDYTIHSIEGTLIYIKTDEFNLLKKTEEKLQYDLTNGPKTSPNKILEIHGQNFTIFSWNVKFKRLLTPYGPMFGMTMLLVELSWISFLIPPEMVPGRAGLLITLCLVLTNYFIYAEELSPPVSGITPLHIWSNMCLSMAIFAFMEYAYILYYIRFGYKKVKRNAKVQVLSNVIEQKERVLNKLANKELLEKTLEDQERTGFQNWARSVDSRAVKIFPLTFVVQAIVYWLYFTNFFTRGFLGFVTASS